MMKLSKLFKVLVVGLSLVLVGCVDNLNQTPPNQQEPRYSTIYFNTGFNEVSIESLTGEVGENLILPSDPSYDGYKFLYWSYLGNIFTSDTYPSHDMILDAVWAKGYYIEFDLGDSAETIDSIFVYEGDPMPELPIPNATVGANYEAFLFDGWLFEDETLGLTLMPSFDIVLVARWKHALAITFDTSDSNIEFEPITLSAGEEVVAPSQKPQKEGYLFQGWLYDGKPYIFEKMPSQSIVLTPNWLDISQAYQTIETLPKVLINLENFKPLSQVTRETYTDSSITLFHQNTDYELNAISAEFKGRGHGSWDDSGPKKGYRIKFYKKQPILNFESSRHWVLLAGANFNDTSLAKNALAFHLGREIFTGMEYSANNMWVELYVNGQYQGVYLLTEHVRVAKGRVDIDSKFGIIDTGYLIEYDAYATGTKGIDYFSISGFQHDFTVSSPDPEDYLEEGISEALFREQVDFMRAYTDQTLTAAINQNFNEFAKWADVDSFVDMYILNEYFKNTDLGWSSFYMYKKPGGKLYAAPPWDFDASAGSNRGDQSPNGIFVAGSVVDTSPHTASELFINLMQTSGFKNLVIARWKQLSTAIKAYVQGFLSESFIEANKFTFGRNFMFWHPHYGHNPNQATAEQNWVNATRNLRNWLLNRANWLDNEWK